MTAVDLLIEPRTRPVGSGSVARLLPFRHRRTVGPFIFVDHIGPDDLPSGVGIDVDAHPHIGLSTLTYLFDGAVVHRDSVGSVQTIEPGAVNWMTAGSGVTHTERSPEYDRHEPRRLHGLQTWVALPDDAEDSPPSFDHRPADEIPHEQVGTIGLRVIAGDGFGLRSPVPVSSPLVLAEITLGGDDAMTLERDHPERAVLALDGEITIADQRVPKGSLAVLADDSAPRLAGSGTAIVVGGSPVGRRHIWWNFVHSDPERIEEAKEDWAAQRFPVVPGDHDQWTALP